MPRCPVRPQRRPPAAALSSTVATLSLALAGLALGGCGSVSGTGPGSVPDPSGSTSTGDTPTARTSSVPLPSAALRSALGCPSGIAVSVDHRLDVSTTHPATVVAAHCDAAAGSPPSGVYLVTRSTSGAASRISATLVPASAQIEVRTLTQDAGTLRVTGVGYSARTVPRCCPDLTVGRAWKVRGDVLEPAG